MIVAKLQLLQVQGKVLFRYSMVFQHSFFGKTPKSLKTINVHSPVRKFCRMIKTQVPAKDEQGLVASKLVRVKDTSFLGNILHRFKDLSNRKILRERRVDSPVSLQHSQNQGLPCSSSPTTTFPSPSKVGIINLNLSREFSKLILGFRSNSLSQFLVDLVYGLVIKVQYFTCLIGWYFQSKVLNDLLYSPPSLKGVSSFASWAINPVQRIAPCTMIVTKDTDSTVHSTVYLNRFSVECT